MAFFEIPLTPNAQKFFITLFGVTYQMQLVWRSADEGGWFLDIADGSGNALVNGVPLVTGANLLAQYTDKGFNGKLFVTTDGDPTATPTFANLGVASHVYFETRS